MSVYTRLDSALFGSLVHALVLTGAAIEADLSAGRVFEPPEGAHASFVYPRRLDLPAEAQAALDAWPEAAGSLFDRARARQLCDQAFRPGTLLQELGLGEADAFGPLGAHRRVADSFCITFLLAGATWGMAVYVRCEPSAPFGERERAAVERFKPAIARVIRGGLQREVAGSPVMSELQAAQAAIRAANAFGRSTEQMLEKLSQTERQILQYLRSPSTERQIGQSIHRSPHTVHVHVKNIYRKLGVTSRRELQGLFGNP